jgi:spermidine synthase
MMFSRGPEPLLPQLRPGSFYIANEIPPEGVAIYCEDTSDPFDIFGFRTVAVQCSVQTEFQNVLIADTVSYGRALFLDGVLQSSEHDEALYHELLVQPAMLAHPNPRDVLIIGGGEGATLREVLAHRSVQRAVMVDIDATCVALCRTHLGAWHRGAMDDPRARLVFTDGRAFVEEDDSFYDVVIIDVVDMLSNGPAQRIYTREFYQHLRKRLRPGGIVVVQGMEFSHIDHVQHAALVRTLRALFSEVHSYQAAIPSFVAPWGFVLASDHVRPYEWQASTIDGLIAQRLGPNWMHHLDGAFLLAKFQLCVATRMLLSMPGPTLGDDEPFVRPLEPDQVDEPIAVFPARSPRP